MTRVAAAAILLSLAPLSLADEETSAGPTAICESIAQRYRPMANANPGKSPLTALSESASSGVVISEPLTTLGNDSTALAHWATAQQPPFWLVDDLQATWDRQAQIASIWELNRLPDTDFYSLSTVAGTAHCLYALYFEVRNGHAALASVPSGFDDEGGAACGARRVYGKLDRHSALFQEAYDYTPRMSSTLTVAGWERGGFLPACRLTFSFAPAFGPKTVNLHQETCTGTDCETLRRAAFQLAAAVQKSPQAALAEQLASLPAKLKSEYEAAARTTASAGQGVEADPDAITDQHPLQLPYLSDGRLYIASIGHFTLGWRHFADWSVRFDALENGKPVPHAAFAVGMSKGELQDLTVAPVVAQKTSR
jgi:hypothetical protein